MIVMKFGGTSVDTTESIHSTAKIVAARVERQACKQWTILSRHYRGFLNATKNDM